MAPHKPFPKTVQRNALGRQKGVCAACKTPISLLGKAGASGHDFGEPAEGHHVIPHSLGGPLSKENCVVICRACHLSVHRGGHWRYTRQYDSVSHLPMPKRIKAIARLYKHYKG